MNNDEMIMIPYIVHESAQIRAEKRARWHFIIIIILILLLAISNGLWAYSWMQYDYTTEEVEIDSGDGNASYIKNGGFVWQE